MLNRRADTSGIRVSTNVSVARTTPQTSFGSRLTAGHQKQLLQSLGLSPTGAEQLVNGAPVSSAFDRAMIKSALRQEANLDNLAIQVLMSKYNQSETQRSSVLKKLDDTHSGTQQKIG